MSLKKLCEKLQSFFICHSFCHENKNKLRYDTGIRSNKEKMSMTDGKDKEVYFQSSFNEPGALSEKQINVKGYAGCKAVEIELEIDSPYMWMFKAEHLEKMQMDAIYKDTNTNHEIIKVEFDLQYAYEVLGLLDCLWGADSRPAIKTIQENAKAWWEKFDAELIRISHDALTFKCRELIDGEIDMLFNEIQELNAESNWRGGFDKLREIIKEKKIFSIWWD